MAKISPVEQTYLYGVPPSKVFSALSEPELLTRWFSDKAVVSLRKGGAYRLTWHTGYTMRGKVKSAVPPKKLSVRWIDRLGRGKTFETEARIVLKKKGGGTVLTVTHRGFKSGKAWTALYGAIQSGWAYYLMNLRSVLEHGTDLRSPGDSL